MATRHTLIIGGGAIGSASAYFLSGLMGKDEKITVVERDPSYQFASSSLSAASIRQQFSTPLSVQLSQFGYAFLRGCVDEDGTEPRVPGGAVGLHESGYLFLGRAEQAESLRARTRIARTNGAVINEFSPAELAARYPWLNVDDIAYACIGHNEGWFDGYMLQQWYRRHARARGVEYVHGEVTGFVCSGSNIVAAQLADGTQIACDRVVNAGGAWSARVAASVGVDIPVRARRRSLFVVSCPPAAHATLADCPAQFPVLVEDTGVFVRPEQQHYLCAFSPPPERDFDDLPLDADFSLFEDHIWPTLAERIPAFEALRVERAWAGYYEFNTADHNGLVGSATSLGGPENFFLATGFSGHGLMQSAGVGRGVAELLTHGSYQTLDLSPLSPERLKTGKLIVEEAVY